MQSTELMHPYSGTIACGPCLPKRSWTRCVAHCEISCFQSWVLFENEGRISTMKPMTPINTWSLFGMWRRRCRRNSPRSEEHTYELQTLMRLSHAVFCLKKKRTYTHIQ